MNERNRRSAAELNREFGCDEYGHPYDDYDEDGDETSLPSLPDPQYKPVRSALAPLVGQRHTFTATFDRMGTYDSYIYTKPTIMLTDIYDCHGNYMCDHMWFKYVKGFEQLGELQQGYKIQFSARINSYQKGYMGYNEYKRRLNPPQTDYRLVFPTKITRID